MQAPKDHIVFFDGYCNFCNASVDFLFRRNRKNNLYYSSLQSDFAKEFLKENGRDPESLHTIYYYRKGKIYKESGAALRICKELRGAWPMMQVFLIFPKFIRDALYRLIAKNRYKLKGRRDTCRMPNEEERQYFIQ